MRYGMPTLIELKTLEENVQLCKSLGLDFVEINMNFPAYQLDNLSVSDLLRLQSSYDVFFTFHLAEDIDMGHLNRTIREAYLKEVLGTIKLMQAIGSKTLNLHMSKGIFVTLPREKINIYEQYNESYIDNIRTFRDEVSSHLEEAMAHIYIENTGIYDRAYIQNAVTLLLENDAFKLTWDIGHDHSSGHKDKDFMEAHSDQIRHYHIHDAIKSQNHLTLYDGEIKLDDFLKRASDSSSTVVIETKTIEALKTSIGRLNRKRST